MQSFINSKNDLGVVYTYLLSASKIYEDATLTLPNEQGMNSTIAFLYSSVPKSNSFVNFQATDKRAVNGQGQNQSITVQFTRAGNFLALCLKFSPTGEKHIAI